MTNSIRTFCECKQYITPFFLLSANYKLHAQEKKEKKKYMVLRNINHSNYGVTGGKLELHWYIQFLGIYKGKRY